MTNKIELAHTVMEELTPESALQVRRGDKVYIRDMKGERLNAVKEGEFYNVRGLFKNGEQIFYAIEINTSLGESLIRYTPYSWCSVERHIQGSDPRNLGNYEGKEKVIRPEAHDISKTLKSQTTPQIKRNFNNRRR